MCQSQETMPAGIDLRIAHDLGPFSPTSEGHVRVVRIVDLLVRAQTVRARLAFRADGDFVRDIRGHETGKQQSEYAKVCHVANRDEALRW
jgi:hypothetical protein